MADLGTYNFIRAARGRGETDDEILATLTRNGMNQQAIDDAFRAANSGKAPAIKGGAEEPKRRGHGLLWTLLFLVIATAIVGYLFWSGRIAPPWKPVACATADQCVRDDVDKLVAQAKRLYAADGGSYAKLCADGGVNFSAAQGTKEQLGIDSALRDTVNDLMLERGAASQQDAGIQCGSRDDRFYISAAMQAGGYYCLDSRGVATTSAPNSGIGFCGSVLSDF